jgi:hypothetical protein
MFTQSRQPEGQAVASPSLLCCSMRKASSNVTLQLTALPDPADSPGPHRHSQQHKAECDGQGKPPASICRKRKPLPTHVYRNPWKRKRETGGGLLVIVCRTGRPPGDVTHPAGMYSGSGLGISAESTKD